MSLRKIVTRSMITVGLLGLATCAGLATHYRNGTDEILRDRGATSYTELVEKKDFVNYIELEKNLDYCFGIGVGFAILTGVGLAYDPSRKKEDKDEEEE